MRAAEKDTSSRWNAAQIRGSVQQRLREMDLRIETDELRQIINENKNDIASRCPPDIPIKDFATLEVTSRAVQHLGSKGLLTGGAQDIVNPEGVPRDHFYTTELYEVLESTKKKLLGLDGTGRSENSDEETELDEFVRTVWRLKQPDLEKRQDQHAKFQNWMSNAKDTVEAIWALEPGERQEQLQQLELQRKRDDQEILDEEVAKIEQAKLEEPAKQNKFPKNKVSRGRPRKTKRSPAAAECSEPVGRPLTTQCSSTNSTRTQSFNSRLAEVQDRAVPALDPRKKLRPNDVRERAQSSIPSAEDQLKKVFGTDSDSQEMCLDESQTSNQIEVEHDLRPPELDLPTGIAAYDLPALNPGAETLLALTLSWIEAKKERLNQCKEESGP